MEITANRKPFFFATLIFLWCVRDRNYFVISIPIFRAVPSMMRSAASIESALRSGGFRSGVFLYFFFCFFSIFFFIGRAGPFFYPRRFPEHIGRRRGFKLKIK